MSLLVVLAATLSAALAAAGYAVFAYSKATPTEDWNWNKFSATVITGAFIGIMGAFTGIPATVNMATMPVQLAAYAGSTAVLENMLKTVKRKTKLLDWTDKILKL